MTSVGGDWFEHVDPSTGAKYYANSVTQETSWEVPPGVTPTGGADPAASAGDWATQVDPSTGQTYYYNTKTNETSWTDPNAPADAAADTAAAAADAGELGTDWKSQSDPNSGQSYFYNVKTNETTWEIPPELAAAQAKAAGDTGAEAVEKPKDPQLSDEHKALWKKVVDFAKAEGSAKITQKNNRFETLRKFAEISAKKKEAPKADAAGGGDSGGGGGGGGGGAGGPTPAAAKGILAMLDVPLPEIEPADIRIYAEEYFNLNRKGMFGKKTSVDKVLKWKNDVIRTALRKMPAKDFNQQATQCFRNITGFMGDRATKKEEGGHAEKLLKNCLHSPEEVRDEVYCQLIKQTSDNPGEDSLTKGWQLFGIVSGAFPPSEEFKPYLLSYIDAHKDTPGLIGQYARYSIGRIVMAGKLGPRREIPTGLEIDACKAMLPAIIRVYHLNGEYESMPVASWTTARSLNEMIAKKLQIKHADAFSVYEMTPEGEERYLEPDERILDLVAYWQRLYEEEKTGGKEKTGTVNLYRIVYKVHMYFDTQEGDTAAEDQMYTQAVYDVTSSRYPCSEEDAVKLAAIQLQAAHGDEPPSLAGQLKHYLPAKFTDAAREAEFIDRIMTDHSDLNGTSKKDARKKYLDFVKTWKIYGSSFFFVEPQMNADLPDEVFLAVNPKGVLIINPDSKDVLAEHPYSEVPTWGHSGSSFVLHIGNLIRQTKMYFQTEQGKEVNDLVRAYVNHLCVA